MKNSYSLLFLLIFSIGIGAINAQTDTISHEYHPLVQEGKMWSELWAENSWISGSPMIYHNYSTYYFMIYGDTIIGDIKYKKLYRSSTKDPVFPDDWTLRSFLRENTNAKKVWIYNWSGSTDVIGEHLLYDFSLEIGDTVPDMFYFSNDHLGDRTIVSNITYETMQNGEIRKAIWFNNGYEGHRDCWIEGIGNHITLILPFGSRITGGFYNLLCHYENEELVYMNSRWNTCYKTGTSLGINDVGSTQIKIYPNPANDVLNIDIENIENYVVSLINIYGKTVGQYKPTHNQINISNLVPGMYFVKLSSQEKEYIQKLIINK